METIEYYFKPTKSCNLACPYCHEQETYRNTQILTPPLVKKILLKILFFHKNNGLKNRIRLSYSGGEVLILGKNWMREILALQKEVFSKSGIKYSTTIQTNLTLIDKEWIKIIRENDIQVSSSLDPFAKTRPFKTGGDSVGTVIDKLILLAENRVGVSLIVVITRQNFDKAKEIYWAMNKARVNFHTLPLHPDSLKYCPELEISPEEYAQSQIEMTEEYLKPANRIRIASLDNYIALIKPGYRAPGGLCSTAFSCIGTRLFFENTGETYFCGCYCKPEVLVGNIFHDSVGEMFRRMFTKKVFKKIRNRHKTIKELCRGCEFLPICNGGCPSFAHQEGNPYSRSNFYCRINKTIFPFFKK